MTIDAAGGAYNDQWDNPSPTYPNTLQNNGVSVFHNAICETGGAVMEPTPSELPLDWQYLPGCALEGQGWGTFFSIGFCTDPSYPYEDGQILGFRGRIVQMDSGPEDGDLCPSGWGGADDGDGIAELNESGNALITFRMRVSPEQGGAIVPKCEEAGPAFTVRASNEGGQPLHDVVTTIDVPAGATFTGVSDVTPTTGVIIEVSEDGATWGELGSIAPGVVRYVRLRGDPDGLELPPNIGQAGFILQLATSLPAGSVLVPSGEMASNFTTSVLTATSFVVGSCQPLRVRKYFDGDADGTEDLGEPGLSNWTFSVSDSTGAAVASGVTGVDGTWEVLLPAGDYVVHEEAAAASADYSWSLTTPQDVPLSFVVGGPGATVAFGNRCVCGTNVCQPLACSSLGGQLASCGAPVPVDCDDGDMCTVDTCDPSITDGDACVNTPVACDGSSGGIFVPVSDATGAVVGAIRCALVDGAMGCDTGADTDGDGVANLVVYPEFAGACGD